LEFVGVAHEVRVSPEGCQVLEKQRQDALVFSQYIGWKIFNRAVLVQESGGGDGADPANPRIPVRGVTNEGEIVGNKDRLNPELLDHARRVSNRLPPPVYLYHAITANALRQVLVG
jgi:hypothetical protein